jgi:hypothetical protein
MVMLRTALVPIAHLAHHVVVVAQNEWRGGKCHHPAGQPDRRHHPHVRTNTHE